MLHAPEAHLVCAALVATDVVARAARLHLVTRALGHGIGLGRAAAIAVAGDAASALTPYRAGGDVVRVAALQRAGLPRSRALLAIFAETVQTWPVILGGGAALLWLYGGTAWAAFMAAAAAAVQRAGFALALLPVVLAGGVWLAARILRRFWPPSTSVGRHDAPLAAIAATLPLTAIAILARVLILPVLASALPAPPAFGPLTLGSFVMLHGQSLLPLPAGAGAVDAGFLAGFRGAADAGRLLVHWRLYTSGAGIALGAAASAYATMTAWRSRRSLSPSSPPAWPPPLPTRGGRFHPASTSPS